MDDSIEQKENKPEQPVGKPLSKEEAAEKERMEREKKTKYALASKEQQEKVRKAWEDENKRKEARGEKITEEEKDAQRQLIERGVVPAGRGASDGNPFADFDGQDYEETPLRDIVRELKEAGGREEITEEKLNEIKQRVYTMSQLGGISDDLRHRFESDINEAILKSQQVDAPSEASSNTAPENGERKDQHQIINDISLRQLYEEIEDLSDDNPENPLILQDIVNSRRELQSIFDEADRRNKLRELDSILQNPDINSKKELLKTFLREADIKRTDNKAKGKIEVSNEVTSMQDLAKFIMSRQGGEMFGYKGKYPLLETDLKTGKEKFNQANFLIWVREQIITLHEDNRTGEMQPLQQVAIETQLKSFSIYQMNRFRGQYFKDEETGEIFNDLADTAVNMCYLFGFFRNMDLAYKQVMNSDEDLPKNIVGIHAKNDVTYGDNWATFLSMPDRFGQAKKDANGNDLRNEKGNIVYDKDTRVGDAELVANDIYYNLSDIDELKDIAGSNSSFMTKEGFKKTLLLQQILTGNKHEWDKEPDERPGFYDKSEDNFYTIHPDTGRRRYVFKKDGSIDESNYLALINFFNAPTPDKTQLDFIRELIRITIAEKAGIESGLARNEKELLERKEKFEQIRVERGIDDAEKEYKRQVGAARINTKFAEYSSFVQQRPLMVAARNDVNRRGYDASTKLDINYILRQSGTGTAGPIGNSEFLKHQIIKNFGVDFVAGLKTESKRSPYEIFREIRHVMNDQSLTLEQRNEKKADLIAELRFQDSAALDYSANAIARSYQIFHQIVDGNSLDLNKIVTRNFLEGIKYNTAEFEKQIKDDFIKPMRYAFSSNSALKYGQMYRSFERLDSNQMPVYKLKTLADHMFGDEVLDDIKQEAKKNKLDLAEYNDKGEKLDPSKMTEFSRYQEYLNSPRSRIRLVKNVARARLAAELRKHRDRWGPSERWNADMINKFILALETIKAYTKDENGNIVETNDRFFADKDISWIRKNSGTGYKSMLAKEGSISVAAGVGKGLFESFKDFLGNTFKS